MPTKLSLRCYAIKRGDVAYANCIDLNLSVERPTLDQAMEELRLMIDSYLESVQEMGCPKNLLYRKSRFSKRVEYYKTYVICMALGWLPRSCDVEVEHRDIPCAA